MNAFRAHDLRASAVLLLAGLCGLAGLNAHAQLAGVLETGTRYAGNSTGSGGFNADSGAASSTTLNAPSYAVFDSAGNLFVSDTQNNCVRKVDAAGNITTVAGLRVSGGPDTCNASLNFAPTPAQGLLAPTGLAFDKAGTLYISDSQHNCVRSLAPGAVDSFAANALTTVAGTCSALDTASVTPVPNGLTTDAAGNLYISIRDSAAAIPVNQVLRHRAIDSAGTVCLLAGQPSANVPNTCAGVIGTATLSSPSGLTLDPVGNLYLADTGNNCVREIAGLTTLQTAVGLCANDSTGSSSTALQGPYGLAATPAASILITQSALLRNSLISFSPRFGTLTQLAGLPTGTSGPYSTALDGQSALSTPLNAPLGLTTDTAGNIFLADSLNNIIRRFTTGQTFPSAAVGATGASQTITFSINQNVKLSTTVGADYAISTNTCSGILVANASGLPPNTCQVTVTFSPTRPGMRASALKLKDANTGGVVSVALSGIGTGSLSLFTPGTVNTLAGGLRVPIAVSVDSSGNAYVLEQGDALTNADVVLIPAGGGPAAVVIPQHAGINTPTAMAVDAAGNIFISDAAANTISRFGVDGTVSLNYISGLTNVSALAVDSSDNLYIAQAGAVHNVIEVFAGGATRIIAGSGSTANADGVIATSAQFVKPSGLALSPAGDLAIADASGQRVYTVDAGGLIHMVAGNGTSSTTDATQATATAMLYPVGLAYDAAGDLYIDDEAANRVYEVYPIQSGGSNISAPLGSGATGYTGDGGPAPQATLQEPFTIALDGASNLYVIDFANNALRQVSYSTTRNIDFGHVILGTSPVIVQTIANAGNLGMGITTPITTTDSHYTTSGSATTCSGSLAQGGVCKVGYTFTPTVIGTVNAQSTVTSTAYDSPQTVNLTAYGITTQNLPYTLTPETEVYGQPFLQSVSLNIVYPDLPATGTMTFTIGGSGGVGGETTCTISSPFGAKINCNAPESGLGVGTYTVNFNFTSGDISYFSTTGTTTLTITPGSLTLTPASVNKAYGAPIPPLLGSVSGAVNGDVFLVADSTTATVASPIGTYPITGTLTPVGLASLSNYNVTYLKGTLTIAPAPLTVTVTDASRPYGAANPTFNSNIIGAANGDTFTVAYSTTATPTSPVGKYPITATITGTNMSDYAVTVVAGTLTVTPIPLTVNVASASRPYGTPNPGFAAAITGAINGDTFTQNITTPAAINSPVGNYPINDTIGGPAAANYTVTVNPGTLAITPATVILSVTANNASRTYGAANPVFTSTINGALLGDTFAITYTTPANASSPVGIYPVTPVISGPAAANYTVAPANGTVTITPAPLTVAAASTSRPYNTANPIFTGTTAGLLNGDTVTLAYSTTAIPTSPVGTYPIVPAVSGAALSNYTLTATNGTLTVTPSAAGPLTVAVNSATRAFGAANPVFTGTVTGLINGDIVTVSYSTTATPTSAPGAYPITAIVSGAAAANYVINIVPGTLAITAGSTTTGLTTSASPIYYGTSVTFTATVSSATGVPNGTVTFLNGSTVLGTATVNSSGVATFTTSALLPGNLTITANYSGSTNFSASTTSIAQVVTAGSFSLTATPASQFIRGAGSTVYTITATSAQGFTGPVTLSCAGLPADAKCTFATPTLTLAAGASGSTTMTVVNTAADAALVIPTPPTQKPTGRFAPIAFAATLPFELTGLGVFLAGRRKRKAAYSSPRLRLFLMLLCTAGLMGLAGCACFTSVYKNYTINVSGSTTVPGVASQTTSVILSVGQQ
ncbi:MAG: hypothetical protein NVSMB62_21010 [Acidobacteriaceae bacterium]